MTDQKISALSDGSPLVGSDQFVIARSGVNYRIPASAVGASELDYVEITAAVSVTGLVGSQQSLITGNSFSLAASTRVCVEIYSPIVSSGTQAFIVELWDGATDLARIGQVAPSLAWPMGAMKRFLTLAAGSHQIITKGWINGGSAASFGAGAGTGGSGIFMPAYQRVTVA
jgi:hypothetical protein